jgi:two-component system, cell cycle sensor histidine kinase and response regulator CckA
MIENAGFTAFTAFDGMEAMQVVTEMKGDIDCILLDHSMPNLNGEQTFKMMKNMFPNIKVIMMSGYNLHDLATTYSEKGLAGYIQKPYTFEILIRTITETINR